jgi:hypothetical protein
MRLDFDMNRFERYLFPRGELLNFFIIVCLSGAISFLLTGRQIYQANWGLIDDHEVFTYLGPRLHLPLSDIWSTLLGKTEVGTLQGRFRPTNYLVKLIETSLWGDNVHLWYLGHTIGFAIFLSSIWWFLRRFVGGWLSGALTAYISLLPLWADVWSRLGPSEIYGATSIGLMVYAAYFTLFSDAPRIRIASAIALTLATVALAGSKETFLPLAGGTAGVFWLAYVRKNLPPRVIGLLALVLLGCLGGIVFVVKKEVSSGADYYANALGIWPVLRFGLAGFFTALARTWWLYVIPILFFTILDVIPCRPLRNWIADSSTAVGAYGFVVASYAAQCALYRSGFPLNVRYDFPAMLLVPLTCCILACEFFRTIRPHFSERAIEYAQFAVAAFLFFCFALGPAYLDNSKALSVAVQKNIETTNSFYNELQLVLRAAEKSPEIPIILEAYGPGAFEPVFSLSAYLTALGARNPVSVRVHSDGNSTGKLYEGLQQRLSALEQTGNAAFVPLRDSLANRPKGCISIGINGSADTSCSGFQVKTP